MVSIGSSLFRGLPDEIKQVSVNKYTMEAQRHTVCNINLLYLLSKRGIWFTKRQLLILIQEVLHWKFIYNLSLALRLTLKCEQQPLQTLPRRTRLSSKSFQDIEVRRENGCVEERERNWEDCHKIWRHVNQHYDRRIDCGLASAWQHYTAFE